MSYKTITYLYCDGGGCAGEDRDLVETGMPFDNAPPPHGYVDSTVTEQRKRARRVAGWVHKDGKDYCAACCRRGAEVDDL